MRRAGLCCTARASRPASAVGVSSNVRPHSQAFEQASRLGSGASTRLGQPLEAPPFLPAPRVGRAQRGAGARRPVKAGACTSASAKSLAQANKGSQSQLAGLSLSESQSVKARCARNASALVLRLHPRRARLPCLSIQAAISTASTVQTKCGLTLRSAPTPHGKPLGRRGALVYAAPRRPSALPRGSRLAQTLGRAVKNVSTRRFSEDQALGAGAV